MTKSGWSELRNPLDSDVPFRLFRDEGRTFIQVRRCRLHYPVPLHLLMHHITILLTLQNCTATFEIAYLYGTAIEKLALIDYFH